MKNRIQLLQVLAPLGVGLAALTLSGVAYSQSGVSASTDLRTQSPVDARAAELATVNFEGTVYAPGGLPAAGSVVVSSAGGQALVAADGSFRLEAQVPFGAERIQFTTVGRSGGKLFANKEVALSVSQGSMSVGTLHLAQSSQCDPKWLPTFGGSPGMNGSVRALAVFDDGNGPALFAGGEFITAVGVAANHVAKWNGTNWEPLGDGVDDDVLSLHVFDDGTGNALYAGGLFTNAGGSPANYIARWNGSVWSAVGTGRDSNVRALAVFDDGGGDALYAGSRFISGGNARVIAKWDGVSWTALGTGLNRSVATLAVVDDGQGDRLFVGGNFTEAGGQPANYVAAWDGSSWAALGNGRGAQVNALAVFDDGNGPALYTGSDLGDDLNNIRVIAKWTGSTWQALGSGLNGSVTAFTVHDDGNGDELVVGGHFTSAGGIPASKLAKWNGTSWTAIGGGTSQGAYALTSFDEGTGARLIAGGPFSVAGSEAAHGIAQWDGTSWSAFGAGLDYFVTALEVFDDGSGPALYAGGFFLNGSGLALDHVAKWNGSIWVAVGGGVDGGVYSMEVFDDGTGEALFVGGNFETAGGVTAAGIAKWDGVNWAGLGSGMVYFSTASVRSLAVHDDGNGEQLYAGGYFSRAGGVSASFVAKWDGTTWAPLGAGMNHVVFAFAIFNDGGGDALYAGGHFDMAGGAPANYVAKWDGAAWSPLASGLDGIVGVLTTFDDGSGEKLIAGGRFANAGGSAANRIASWDGLTWSRLGSGMEGFFTQTAVHSLAVHDEGGGPRLFAGGAFTTAGGLAANRIARWDGSSWSALGGGMGSAVPAGGPLGPGIGSAVTTLLSFDDGNGEALFAGGDFLNAVDSNDSYVAKWACPSPEAIDHCNGDGGDQVGCTMCPCSNKAQPGTIGGCLNSALSSARLFASGDPSVSLQAGDVNDLRFSLTGAPPTGFCLLNSGDGLAPVNPAHPCFGLGSGAQATAFDGLRCAALNTRRHGGRSAGANGDVGFTNSPWGGEGEPPAGIANVGAGYVAGQTRFFQVINRDDPLLSCQRGLNTSQALEITFAP